MKGVINKRYEEAVAVGEIEPHPENPREGDVGAIYEMIKKNGFYGSLIVQESTSYILAGNHRYQAAVRLGYKALPVMYADVDDEAARRILLSDNRANDLASYDREGLHDVLTALFEESEDLTGTGYDEDDLQELARDLEENADFTEVNFRAYDENIETNHTCPKCGYEF